MSDVWGPVDRLLVDGVPERQIINHRLEQLAARRLRERGLPLPSSLLVAERRAAAAALTGPAVLARVRRSCTGPIVVFKGPEVAAYYRDPLLRSYKDLDLLVPDADAVQAQLIDAGFVPVGDPSLYLDIHHLRPLSLPELGLSVEVHSRPKWVDGLPAPAVQVLLDAAVPSATGIEGISALPAPEHALVLAAHAWAHEPLRRLRDILDVAVVAAACEPGEIEALAAAWGVERLWRSTRATIDAVLAGERLPRGIRVWARSLATGEERTVLENHLMRWLSGFAIFPARQAVRRFGSILRDELLPADEPWRSKIRRTALALRHAGRSRSEHNEQLGLP